MEVIVYTFHQPYLASVDNCNLILIAQLYRRANGSNCIYILSPIYLEKVDFCIMISIAQFYRMANERNCIYNMSTNSCKY